MKLGFTYKEIDNVVMDAPKYFDGKEMYAVGPLRIWFEYSDGRKQEVDKMEITAISDYYLILYRIGDDVFCTQQAKTLTFNGRKSNL